MKESFSIQKIADPKLQNANGNIRCNDRFEIVWIFIGTGVLRLDLRHTPIADNKLFFIQPGQLYEFQPGGDLDGYTLSFTDTFLDFEDGRSDATYYNYLFKLSAAATGMTIAPSLCSDLLDLIGKMQKEFGSGHLLRMEILRRYFKIFLLYLTRELEDTPQLCSQSRSLELVGKFSALLDKKFKTHKMVAHYAGDLMVTPSYLNDVIRKVTGRSAGYHIRQRIALEAKRLSVCTDGSMKEIAYTLGFCDSAHFSKFFKLMTGETFTDFKRQNLLKEKV
jgi:AraC-like DNA-binding protein